MRINHNIAALNTYRQLSNNNAITQKSLEKLSSGLRINRAGDDAAGLAISEKMRGQIRGLEQASRNAQDSISLIQTAEGALNETHSILQRMRELAVQSSNGTATDADRQALQDELVQLKSEIDRISTDTEFNTKKLLNGDVGMTLKTTANGGGLEKVVATNASLANDTYTITVGGTVTESFTVISSTGWSAAAADFTATGADAKFDTYTLKITQGSDATHYDLELRGSDGELIGTLANVANNAAGGVGTTIGGIQFAFDTRNITGPGEVKFSMATNGATFTVTNSAGTTLGSVTSTGETKGYVEVGGFKVNIDSSITADASTYQLTNNSLGFHIGANKDQNIKLAINDMGTEALGIKDIDISTQSGANSAISTINDAIELVSTERSKLGAYQNRLEHTINNLGTSAENLTASESRIRDVDMAKEMMEFTKMNILSQAAQAMLAQANQQPQGVLQLLR